jgi:hypothetical protein
MRLSAAFLLLSSVAWCADPPDLSGTWILNTTRSTLGRIAKPEMMTLTVTRNGEGYHSVQKSTDGSNKDTVVEGDWFLDGKDHPVPSTDITQMSKWEGPVLVAEKKSADGTYHETMRVSVSNDGKTATERISVKSPNGNSSSVLIWERK